MWEPVHDREMALMDWWERIFRWMIRIGLAFAAALLAVQLLLMHGGIRSLLCKVERLEGVPYPAAGAPEEP
ncbi:diadenosine tetraphosphatase [Paenibacillus dendritiformis]|uniref:diadenosine tetraphosphatase n=1 Tax=Paenibacillus dendritiformis TaxID=130049 RepID=UPI001A7E4AFF|nr:diadenosine tetraphosphatase [Paenibacillus dendritiformis]